MRAWNKKRKPKHTTRLKWKLSNYGQSVCKIFGVTKNNKVARSFYTKTVFYKGRRFKKYSVPKIAIHTD